MTEQIKFLQNPKELSDRALHYIILNVFPESSHGKEELRDTVRKWYKEVEEEFNKRDIKLHPIMDCNYNKG